MGVIQAFKRSSRARRRAARAYLSKLSRGRLIAVVAALLVATVLTVTVIWIFSQPDDQQYYLTHKEYSTRLKDAGLLQTKLGQAWLDAGEHSLKTAVPISLPHNESAWFQASETRAVAWRFNAHSMQTLNVTLRSKRADAEQFFIDVFESDQGATTLKRLAHPPEPKSLEGDQPYYTRSRRFAITNTGVYILRLQPELLFTGGYTIDIHLESPFGFPVRGKDKSSIQSKFGAPRDAGKRKHKGIDIFAPHRTPVVAAAGGVISRVGNSKRGGRHIWQQSKKYRFYYAHLDEFIVEEGEAVQKGELLGFVGNTGNAITTPPHLHFEIRDRWGRAFDPYPYVSEQSEADKAPGLAPPSAMHRVARVNASKLRLRYKPGLEHKALAYLSRNELLFIEAKTKAWTRVRGVNGAGWVASQYLGDALVKLGELNVSEGQFLYSGPDEQARLGNLAQAKAFPYLGDAGSWQAFVMEGHIYWVKRG